MFKDLKEIWQNIETKEKRYLKSGLYIILIIGFISVIFFPWLLTRESISFVDYNKTGAIGDTINGIAGPFIALAGAILTFLAFYIQYKANLEQRNQFTKTIQNQEKEAKEQLIQYNRSLERQNEERKEQEKIWKTERFENQFYEMVRLHKENVNEISLKLTNPYFTGTQQVTNETNLNGRIVFKYFLEEIKIIYYVAKKTFKNNTSTNKLINKSYGVFFHGLPYQEEKEPNKPDQKEYTDFINTLLKINFSYVQGEYRNLKYVVAEKTDYKNAINLNFKIGEGHSSYLAHYYRHLYQTVKFIVNQNENFISYEEKRKYLRMLRAQLSNEEQAMLFYNWKSEFGNSWENERNHFFTDYRMIHNIYAELIIADFSLIKIFKLMNDPYYRKENNRENDPLFEFEDW